ncbi:MAG: NAD(P)H-hydrate dehydratase [Chloroflexi bacterium]|nr:NAD(P)H-hydrate dehydratase [Chloroflexota bacterium]
MSEIATEPITAGWARSVLPERPLDANKGTFGKVLVVAGSVNYIGAAYLACSGAMRVGAGLVTLATPASVQPILASKLTEVTHLPLPELRLSPGVISEKALRSVRGALSSYNVLLVGCGLGQNKHTESFVYDLLLGNTRNVLPSVIDADALNVIRYNGEWWQSLTDNAILTPHPGEMSRLTGLSVEKVQSARAGIARKMAQKWHKTVVLKGANTIVAASDGKTMISPFANPGLASAGTGDVLSGVIAGLLAQGLTLTHAAACGVYLHGTAGEMVSEKIGDAGMIASDLLPVLPLAIKRLKEN